MLAARESIYSKQILLEGIDPTSKIAMMNGLELKAEFNKILKEIGFEGKGVWLVMVLKARKSLRWKVITPSTG
jgi:hypothetical protein